MTLGYKLALHQPTCINIIVAEAWIRNHIHYKMWDEITYPFLNFNGATVEVSVWINNFTPDITGVCGYFFMLEFKLIHVCKRGHWSRQAPNHLQVPRSFDLRSFDSRLKSDILHSKYIALQSLNKQKSQETGWSGSCHFLHLLGVCIITIITLNDDCGDIPCLRAKAFKNTAMYDWIYLTQHPYIIQIHVIVWR